MCLKPYGGNYCERFSDNIHDNMFKTFIPENPDLNETFGEKNLLGIEDTGGDNGIIARAPRVYGDYSGDYSLDPDRIGSFFCLLPEYGYLVPKSRCQITLSRNFVLGMVSFQNHYT